MNGNNESGHSIFSVTAADVGLNPDPYREADLPGLDFSDLRKVGWRLSNFAQDGQGVGMIFVNGKEGMTSVGADYREALENIREQLRREGILATLDPSKPDDIRAKGWMVAVHNDYRLGGQLHTFWLFTNDHRCVKGEGLTDTEALNQVREQLDKPPVPYAQNAECKVVDTVSKMSQPVERP